ncbi:hypothetical protein MTsPCn9_05560 [Croceitalea sp. MTPC9]|uniref:hypothetical protein n=1 Tax=unclassified Croceitalea TaxID=2632280 RepID=UPI002B36E059|nr:hypothetical protein MTsPCn6_03150 [Croceitalea sp. MTPC6]GMN15620.1 hypothetical protein MTsPCn9_05560 [Croceitalea sp. MTPC9]
MEKKNRGFLYSIIGMIFTSLGMGLLVMEKPGWSYLSCTIIGVLLALYGVIKIVIDNKKKHS